VSRLSKCLTRPEGYFVTDESFDTLFQQVVATFGEELSRILHGEEEEAATLDVLVDVIAVCLENRPGLALQESFALSLIPDVFALAFLLPKALPVSGFSVAQEIWTSWLASAPAGLQKEVGAAISARLHDAIFHTSILVR
jgi:E3 ubiquitin-protein ligase listerin